MPSDRLKIGVSQCLAGDAVRYDGGHKLNAAVAERLGAQFELLTVCPEVESGMGVPRETVKLTASGGETRMIGTESGTDHTEGMREFALRRVQELTGEGLRGYVLKSRSPSCGLNVSVEGSDSTEPGLFAAQLLKELPDLPVVEETDLADETVFQGFVERVFAYDRQMLFFSQQRSVGQLVMSHAQVKLQLDAHSPQAHAEVGQVFEKAAELPYEQLCELYLSRFMHALATPATPASHVEVMKSVFAGVRPDLPPPAQKELARAMQEYRQEIVALSVPLTLLRHYVRICEHPTFHMQTYLEPGPRELILRTRY